MMKMGGIVDDYNDDDLWNSGEPCKLYLGNDICSIKPIIDLSTRC